ncbi:hypothetical protein D3C81_1050090 [compost metagenome]|jgi:hypothetical protein|uniref:DUF6022 family protein n=1 Tax=Paenibacillus rhizolycopersici TaxID=2780073 RepID=UPI000FA4F2F0
MNPQDLPLFHPDMSIEEIGEEGNRYIGTVWKSLYDSMHEELTKAFLEIEDAAYALYLNQLMPPLFNRLMETGFEVIAPVEEDDFVIGQCLIFRNSLEKWGSEENRSRIFWNVIHRKGTLPLGTLLTEIPHSHLKFDIPETPKLYTLRESIKDRILHGIRHIKDK